MESNSRKGKVDGGIQPFARGQHSRWSRTSSPRADKPMYNYRGGHQNRGSDDEIICRGWKHYRGVRFRNFLVHVCNVSLAHGEAGR